MTESIDSFIKLFVIMISDGFIEKLGLDGIFILTIGSPNNVLLRENILNILDGPKSLNIFFLAER